MPRSACPCHPRTQHEAFVPRTALGVTIGVLLASAFVQAASAERAFWVAPSGNDSHPGTEAAPFATLERARDAIRSARQSKGDALGPVTVHLRGGLYQRRTTFALTQQDSGRPNAPVVYRAHKAERVRLMGGRPIPPDAFKPVTDVAVLRRLPTESRGKVLQVDLKAQGITDYGTMKMRGFPQPIVPAPLELFFNGQPMTLARWPNDGWVKTGRIIDRGSVPRDGDDGNRPGTFVYAEDRPARWTQAGDVWMFGYWCWDWADETIRVAKIDTQKRQITLAAPHHYGLKEGMRYYALNLLEEIDRPGEWYLDRKTGLLVFWPPGDIGGAEISISLLETPMVTMRNVNHVTVRGLTLECMRGTAVQMIGGRGNRIADCTFRNIGNVAVILGEGQDEDGVVGLLGASVFSRAYQDTVWNRHAGKGHRIEGCVMSNLGEGGILLGGGDRITLERGGNAVVNNHIYNYSRSVTTNRPAVWVDGVGNRVAHNRIHDAPHTAIMFWGNDHVIELNELHDVCKETGDVGVIYTGRDWTMRGTTVRHNYIHDVHGPGHGGAQGIYLDDCASGTVCFGNVLVNVARAFLIGGGRDNVVENNVMVGCGESVSLDARGIGWMAKSTGAEGILIKRLGAVPYKEAVWRSRYPTLLKIRQDEPGSPKGNVLRNNVIHKCGPMRIHDVARKHGTIKDNLDTKEEPGFVDLAKGNCQLKDDSPVYKKLPGFRKIPFGKIGIHKQTDKGGPQSRRASRARPNAARRGPDRWARAIRAFEQRDARKPPPKGAILFVGSSSIRGWDLTGSYPGLKVINRGFGGSQFADAAYYADRIILPYRPKTVVIYSGDNDLAAGKDPQQVFADCQTLVGKIRSGLPNARVIVLSIKLCGARWRLRDKVRRANALIEGFAKHDPKVTYVDVATPLLGPDGKPRPELFRKDRLHLNAKGYEVWASLVKPLLKTNGT